MILKERIKEIETKRKNSDHYVCFVNHGETRDEALKRMGLCKQEKRCVILVRWLD